MFLTFKVGRGLGFFVEQCHFLCTRVVLRIQCSSSSFFLYLMPEEIDTLLYWQLILVTCVTLRAPLGRSSVRSAGPPPAGGGSLSQASMPVYDQPGDHLNALLFCYLFGCGAMEDSLETFNVKISHLPTLSHLYHIFESRVKLYVWIWGTWVLYDAWR